MTSDKGCFDSHTSRGNSGCLPTACWGTLTGSASSYTSFLHTTRTTALLLLQSLMRAFEAILTAASLILPGAVSAVPLAPGGERNGFKELDPSQSSKCGVRLAQAQTLQPAGDGEYVEPLLIPGATIDSGIAFAFSICTIGTSGGCPANAFAHYDPSAQVGSVSTGWSFYSCPVHSTCR